MCVIFFSIQVDITNYKLTQLKWNINLSKCSYEVYDLITVEYLIVNSTLEKFMVSVDTVGTT